MNNNYLALKKRWHSAFQKSVKREYQSNQYRHLSAGFTLWLDTLGYKPRTVKQAGCNIDEFFAYMEQQGIVHLNDFENHYPDQYTDYLGHRTNCIRGGSLSPAYINKHITAIRLLSKYLQLTTQATFTMKPVLLKTTETATYLSKEEISSLYKSASDEKNRYNMRDTAMLSLFYGCGLRAGEGEALNVSDILFTKDLVYVRKGKNYRERYVPMNRQVRQDLRAYITDQRSELLQSSGRVITEALLLGRHGRRWSVHGMYSRLQLLKQQTGNESLKHKTFGLHILRHSIATHLLQSGMKLEFISHFLGHKSLETTQKYTHLVKEEGC